MDDFERMMLQEGVRPIAAKKPISAPQKKPLHTVAIAPKNNAPSASKESSSAMQKVYWQDGAEARKVLEGALALALQDDRKGKYVWITGILQNGRATTFRLTSSVSEIITRADRESIRILTIGGDGWTFVMHPAMGIATIERDPD